jgi:thiol:disulfide interchange protein DsbD
MLFAGRARSAMEASRRQTRRDARGAAALLLVSALSALAVPAYAAPATASRHVQAELVSEVESIQPGQPFWLGLHLKMEPGWHTYWKNPGDSGLPTRLTWKLPDGFEAAPIEWPYPKPFSQGPVTSYGYERDVLLPVRVTPRASLTPGQPVTLAARADWLECREQCLPGRAELKVTLNVAATAPHPVGALAAVFAQTRKKLPAVPAGWTFEAADSGAGLELQLRPPESWGPIEQAYFFSEQAEVVDHAAPQSLASAANGYRLDLVAASNAARPVARLRGVLVTVSAESGTRAVRVEAPVAKKVGGLRPPSKEEKR